MSNIIIVLVMKFETENAKYNLNPGRHSRTTKEDVKGFDVIILESGPSKYENIKLGSLNDFHQYKKISEDASRLKKPIYIVDMPTVDSEIWFDMQKAEMIAPLYMIPLALLYAPPPAALPLISAFSLPTISGLLPNINAKPVTEINSYLSISNFYTPCGFRSAISAKKIEENIAPAIRKKKGEKPKIFVEYGGGHVDMKHYLKSNILRESVIKLHSIWNYFPFDIEYLNLIKEFNFDNEPVALGEIVSNHDYEDNHKEIIYKTS